MKSKTLGNSDLDISRVGFGAWALGSSWDYGWGQQDDRDSLAAIDRALDAGIDWIDTAPVYGLGHSESVVGKALKSRRDKTFVFTKCGLVWDDENNVSANLTAASVTREIDASLERLGVDTIDLYQIQWPNPDALIEEAWGAMDDARRAGKIRYLGASNFDIAQLERVQHIAPVTSLQPQYSMVYTEPEAELLPYCEKHGIGIINYSPMGSGLLTGKMSRERLAELPADDWRKDPDKAPQFAEPRLSRNLGLAAIATDIAVELGCTVPEVSIAWTLQNTAITAAIVGMRSASQVDGIIGAPEVELTAKQRQRIRDYLDTHP